MHRYFLALIFLICTEVAYSQPSKEYLANEIANNISDEYTTCGSYYGVLSGALDKSGEKSSAQDYEQASDRALELALTSAKIGRDNEMAEKVTLARLNMSLNEMKELIGADYSNMSILLNEYGKRCQWVMENTEEFMEEWQKKILKKYGSVE